MLRRVFLIALLALLASSGRPLGAEERLVVSIAFPGGSGRVIAINSAAGQITLSPSVHENRGWACWWYIQISGAVSGESLTVDVGEAPWATPDRAAISSNRREWSMTAAGKRDGRRIAYRVKAPASTFWMAWGPPFVLEDAQRLVRQASQKKFASAFELCRTRGDRPVPGLRVWEGEGTAEHEVWIQARQHAWEAGSSWVGRGLVEWLVSDDERARRLRRQVAFTVVPVMDIDNVVIGAGGKNQVPQDHNRDWSDKPHWRAVAAAMEQLRQMNKSQRLGVFIDLHNPGASARQPYFYITPRALLSERGIRNLDRFLACAQEDLTGPLPFRGETHESGRTYDRNWKAISKNWVSMHSPEHVVAVTLETAWNTPNSNTTGYRTVGRQLGASLERYFRMNPRN